MIRGARRFFSVSATGRLKYQWWFEEAPISNATNATYNSSTSRQSRGRLLCRYHQHLRQRDDEVATLTVLASNAPAITTQPRSATNFVVEAFCSP